MNVSDSHIHLHKRDCLQKCILLVDDDEPTNILHQLIWEETGVVEEIRLAYSGREALEYLKCCRENQDSFYILPDIILLDVNMPLMNGFEFLRTFRQLPGFPQEQIKVVILTTSLLLKEYQQEYKDLRVNCYCNKPLTSELAMEIACEKGRG